MTDLADFLLKYGGGGLAVILMTVVVFLYKELRKAHREKEEMMKNLYEKNEANALKFAEGAEKLRQTMEGYMLARKRKAE
jgi:hypothetical protein